MAQITPDTFDPLRRFVSVRLQQGVPIVDADWNEKDDVRRFELRTYLKWFVGDGVPFDSDAFRIRAVAVPEADNVLISAGVPAAPVGESNYNAGLRHVGRCLVDGAEATITTDVDFRGQELHTSQPGAAALATQRDTVVIDEMPVLDGTVCIYLDLWDRIVRPDELPALVFPDIGTESCARVRGEWVVRARVGTAAPQSGDADFQAGHYYYAIATVRRVAADPVVFPSQVEDQREQRLLTPPATLIGDMLGTSPDRYRRGLDRPAVPVRTAINALLRGELPATDDQPIAPDVNADFATRAAAMTGLGETAIFWHSNRVAATNQIFGTSWPDVDPASAAAPPVQVTDLGAQTPSLVLLPTTPTPSYFVSYQSQNDIRFRRAASIGGLPAEAETPIAAQAEIEGHPVSVRTDDIVSTFWHWNGPGANDRIRFRRRQYDPTWTEGAAAWLEGETTDLSSLRPRPASAQPWMMHAATDSAGRVWIAFETFSNNIAVARLTAGTGAVETWTDLELDSGSNDRQPFVLVDEPDRVWVFWRADGGIFAAEHDIVGDTWGAATAVPGTAGPIDDNERPTAVRDEEGGIWLIWSRDSAAGTDIWTTRRNPGTGGWGTPRQITASPGDNDFSLAFMADGAIRLVFRSNRSGQFDLFTKTIITTI
jgi:hypothetical protein